jgi:hypothetical protein
MKKTTFATRKLRLEQWMTSVLGDPVTIYVWAKPTISSVRVSEVSALHGNGGYSWMQAEDDAAPIILLTERALVEWDHRSDRQEDLSRLASLLTKG